VLPQQGGREEILEKLDRSKGQAKPGTSQTALLKDAQLRGVHTLLRSTSWLMDERSCQALLAQAFVQQTCAEWQNGAANLLGHLGLVPT
jgi:hypothetical protein